MVLIPVASPEQHGTHLPMGSDYLNGVERAKRSPAKSLVRHGFRHFLILNAHGGNRAITTYIVDRINQETGGIAVDLSPGGAMKTLTPG